MTRLLRKMAFRSISLNSRADQQSDEINRSMSDAISQILHNNARPHTTVLTRQALQKLRLDVLPHPPYSPDLAPAYFALFPRLKRLLQVRIFESRDSLEHEVSRVILFDLPRDDFAVAFDSLLPR